MSKERMTQKQYDMIKMLANAGVAVKVDLKNRPTAQILVKKGYLEVDPSCENCYRASDRGIRYAK